MCFFNSGRVKTPPPVKVPELKTPPPMPEQTPKVESGADTEAGARKKKKSLFQIDLTIPGVGSNSGSSPSGGDAPSTGAATR